MRRTLALGAAASLVAVATVATAPASIAAPVPVTTGASAYAAPAGTGGATLSATLGLGGAIGGLLNGLISPIVSGALNPLVAALQGTINSTVASTLGASSSLVAGTPIQQTGPKPTGAFPGDPFPATCTTSSTTQPCFNLSNSAVNAAPLASVGVGLLRGYTEQVQVSDDSTNPIFGRAQVASPTVSVLPAIPSLVNPLVAAGVVDAKANCPNDGSTAPTASVTASSVSLLGGLIKLTVLANGTVAGLVVNGTNIGALASLPLTTLPGAIVVQSYGTALRVDIPLGLDQLLAGLGLGGSAVAQLLGDVTSASLKLSLIVGPSVSVTATSAKAWGLGVGVDLAGSARFDLLGLVTATVAIPSGIGGGNFGNVLDLRLGYAACQSGTSSTGNSTAVVPPALI